MTTLLVQTSYLYDMYLPTIRTARTTTKSWPAVRRQKRTTMTTNIHPSIALPQTREQVG